jgi:type IV pilus assembly protein PilP
MKRVLAILLVLGVSACGSDEPAKSTAGAGGAAATKAPHAPPKKAAPLARKGAEPPPATDPEAGKAPPKMEFQEADFSETERSRDPFRSFIDLFIDLSKAKVSSQLNVVAKQYTIEELKLVAIVTRIEPSRAMFVDPSGKGHVVDHGDFIGKAEIVQAGSGSADYEIHWRVDRIRDNDVVLVREDPANPGIPTATRVIPLRVEDTLVDSP